MSAAKTNRCIHQIWYQGVENLPYRYRVLSDRIKALHPDYEHLIWSEKELSVAVDVLCSVLGDNSIREVYDSYPYMINRIDLGKYVILYLMGGLYVDMDMYVVRNMDPLFGGNPHADRVIVSATANFYANLLRNLKLVKAPSVNNAVLWAPPRSPAILNIIRECQRRTTTASAKVLFVNKTLYVLYSTGPWVLSKCIERQLNDPNGGEYHILDSKYLHSCRENDDLSLSLDTLVDRDTFALHLYDKQWDKSKGVIIPVLFVIIIIIVIVVAYWFISSLFKQTSPQSQRSPKRQ